MALDLEEDGSGIPAPEPSSSEDWGPKTKRQKREPKGRGEKPAKGGPLRQEDVKQEPQDESAVNAATQASDASSSPKLMGRWLSKHKDVPPGYVRRWGRNLWPGNGYILEPTNVAKARSYKRQSQEAGDVWDRKVQKYLRQQKELERLQMQPGTDEHRQFMELLPQLEGHLERFDALQEETHNREMQRRAKEAREIYRNQYQQREEVSREHREGSRRQGARLEEQEGVRPQSGGSHPRREEDQAGTKQESSSESGEESRNSSQALKSEQDEEPRTPTRPIKSEQDDDQAQRERSRRQQELFMLYRQCDLDKKFQEAKARAEAGDEEPKLDRHVDLHTPPEYDDPDDTTNVDSSNLPFSLYTGSLNLVNPEEDIAPGTLEFNDGRQGHTLTSVETDFAFNDTPWGAWNADFHGGILERNVAYQGRNPTLALWAIDQMGRAAKWEKRLRRIIEGEMEAVDLGGLYDFTDEAITMARAALEAQGLMERAEGLEALQRGANEDLDGLKEGEGRAKGVGVRNWAHFGKGNLGKFAKGSRQPAGKQIANYDTDEEMEDAGDAS